MKLSYATTNPDKFIRAKVNLAKFNIKLEQHQLELLEPQIFDGEKIAAHKVKQAYELTKTSILVSDDSWKIPALQGFPGPFMKTCNHFLKALDWMKLMANRDNKSITLLSHLAYYDGKKIKIFTQEKKAYFLNQPQGIHPEAPHLEAIAWKGEKQSVAQEISNGIKANDDQLDFWQQVATYIKMKQQK